MPTLRVHVRSVSADPASGAAYATGAVLLDDERYAVVCRLTWLECTRVAGWLDTAGREPTIIALPMDRLWLGERLGQRDASWPALDSPEMPAVGYDAQTRRTIGERAADAAAWLASR